MATKDTTPKPVTPVATDVFNPVNVDPFLKPDKILVSLEEKLRKATESEAIKIQKQIDARQAELTAEYGSVGFGSGGYVIPNYAYSEESGAQYGDLLAKQKAVQAALAGRMQLTATGVADDKFGTIYQGQYFGPQGQIGYVRDPETGELVDQYQYAQKVTLAQLAGQLPKGANLKTFYDATGRKLTPTEVAQTVQGQAFAKAGWDIGFGPGETGGVAVVSNDITGVGGSLVTSTQGTGNANTTVSGNTNYSGGGTTTNPLKLNGANFTGSIGGVNYVNGVKEDTAKRTAQQEFRATLADFGLADLADAVDNLIRQDYTVSQIRLELPKQQAYKDRFPGMEALRAAGQAVNEATYISMERGYLQTLQAYGLDTKALGSRKQLGTYVSNLVSPREFEERVNLAATRVKDNADVISQFKTYYPEVDNSALTAYLLNPTVGMDIIKKQVRLAEIGAAAMDVGFATGVSLSTAEELRGAVGEQDYQTVRSAFAQAKVLSDQQARLARLEGTAYSQNEAIQGIVGRDIQSQMASQKRAERETMTRFGGRSGVTSTSLRSDTEI